MHRARFTVCTLAALALAGCSGSTNTSGFSSGSGGGSSGGSGGSSGSGSGSGSGSSSGGFSSSSSGGSGGSSGSSSGGTTTTTTTIYAHTDTELYTLNPQSNALTVVGTFSGLSGSSSDDSVTDLAVNAAGDVWVNSETVIYKATLPSGGTGSVALTSVSTIGGGSKFYALGFTTKDALGSGTGEVLIGGDGNGELWAIDTSNGTTKDVGGFGTDPNDSSAVLALSGDVMFYVDSSGSPKGLATIRSCTKSSKGSTTCDGTTDYLAAIDMTALAAAYSGSGTSTLNAGIYGSTSALPDGPGIGFKDVFGLGAWNGSVFGFTRETGGVSATLVSIATSGSNAGAGSPTKTQANVTSGWSGAGVTTSVTVTVPPPPPPPK